MSQPCLESALSPLTQEAPPARPGPVPWASPIPTYAPDRADSSPEQPGDADEAAQWISWVGWRRLGVGDSGPRGEKADWPPFSKHKMAFEYRVPSPPAPPPPVHPQCRAPPIFPSVRVGVGAGVGAGVGRRSPLRRRAPATSLPPNCQLTGPAARLAALSSCSSARPWARTAHV